MRTFFVGISMSLACRVVVIGIGVKTVPNAVVIDGLEGVGSY